MTFDHLAANAFRTLGLSGSANRTEIAAAARRLRIWSDPARIPPTPWDLPALGPVDRSRQNIEQAVAQLDQPASRIDARLLWYCGSTPPTYPAPPNETSPDSTVVRRHTSALTSLHWASVGDADAVNPDPWRAALQQFARLVASTDFLAWQKEIEATGDFEKRASDDEVLDGINAVPSSIRAAISIRARGAFNRQDFKGGAALAAALGDDGGAGHPSMELEGLFDDLEDALDTLCREADAELRDKLRTNRESPEPFYAANRQATFAAAHFYNVRIDPALASLGGLSTHHAERLMRSRTRCASVLTLIALGWEWSGEFVTAEETLLNALQMLLGSPGEAGVRKDIERVRPYAERARSLPAVRDQQQSYWRQQGALNTAGIAGDSRQPVYAGQPGPRRPAIAPSRFRWYATGLLLGGLVLVTILAYAVNNTYRGAGPKLRLGSISTQPSSDARGDSAGFNPDQDPETPPGGPPALQAATQPSSVGEVNREP